MLLFSAVPFNCSSYDGTDDEKKILMESPDEVIEGSGEEETTGKSSFKIKMIIMSFKRYLIQINIIYI